VISPLTDLRYIRNRARMVPRGREEPPGKQGRLIEPVVFAGVPNATASVPNAWDRIAVPDEKSWR
jgi:hypothetical protein